MKIFVLNAGSSSQKSCLYEVGDSLPERPPAPLWEARIDWGRGGIAELSARSSLGVVVRNQARVDSRPKAIRHLFETLWGGKAPVIAGPAEIDVVGHRVVHGGQAYREATVVTPEVKTAIARLAAFAPLHNRADLEGIEAVEQMIGPVPQVAVFDTGFHSHLPLPAAAYPGPYEWLERGIRRYGFHGINHQYCARRAAQILGKDPGSLRLITCHLGNGCSLAAIRHGRSIDTTMGFTPLDGLMMGTRSGSVDPGILTYLLRESHLTAEQLDRLLNQQSGLLGISGISSDMRDIVVGMNQGQPRAKLAFEMFVHRLQSFIGAMLAALDGVDALIFTAGIGENSPEVRAAACANLGFLGLKLDPEKNRRSPADEDIAAGDSAVRVLIVTAQEDWAIAEECWKLMRGR